MTTFPGSPRLIRGGIVLLDADSGVVQRIIALQYNPDTLTRTLQPQNSGGGESNDRLEALRIKGPPIETIKLEAEIDATDQLEYPDQNATTAQFGLSPQLAALETIVYPPSSQVQSVNNQATQGILEVAPIEAPLTLFIWSKTRVLPVRLTEFSITEEAFDPQLNPLRARISLGMRVLSTNDLQFIHRGGSMFIAYHQQLEGLAKLSKSADLGVLGLSSLGGI